MRVLHAVHNFPPEFRGGIERAVEVLAAEQIAARCEVTILAGSEREHEVAHLERETFGTIPVLRACRGRGFRDPIDPFRADLIPIVEEALRLVRPDILHVHHWSNLGGDLVRRAARAGIPAVVTLHDFYSTCSLFFRLPDQREPCDQTECVATCTPCVGERYGVDHAEVRLRVASRVAGFEAELRAAGAVLAPSASHAAALRPHLPVGVSVEVIPLGSPARRAGAPSPQGRTLRVLHFGNLCRIKGVEFLNAAVRRAREMGADVDLMLAGPLVEFGMDLDGARLSGPFDENVLDVLAADADVACFPSFARESYSLVVDEALRLGMPLLVSDRGALAERVLERGLVLPAGDVLAWAAALVRLSTDRTALPRLRAGAPAPLSEPAEHARRVLAVYARVAGVKPPPVDLEGPLVDRLIQKELRMGEILEFVQRLHRERTTGP